MALSRRERPLPFHKLFFLFLSFLVVVFSASASASASASSSQVQATLRELISAAGQQDGHTCSPDKPCSNGACCGASGWCGFKDEHCGEGCQSNCDATSKCGAEADPAGKTCPLNVCCSPFGFCGTTSAFCGDGCQSNCDQPKPSVPESNVQKRVIGYWETWNMDHACGTMSIGGIPVDMLTHLNVAFAYITNGDFRITNMDGVSPDVYRDVGKIKSRNPGIKLVIALGGWTFSDPGQWQDVFPTMASSKANRALFIQNLLGFLAEYGYDGVDFDWEYPGAKDRGGSAVDGENYTALLKELRAAIEASGRDHIVTFTAPSSYWYLRHFDLKAMEPHVDWINLMSYDLHGVWDSNNPIGNQVLAHTNLTEIDLALNLFWRVGIEPSSIVLGLGFYGRSFELENPSCWKQGCPFTGAGAPGPCTGTPGILSYGEVTNILETTGAEAYLDDAAAVRYMVYKGNNWISFDDAGTFQSKIEYANSMGLSGLMVWAIDLDNANLDALRAIVDPGVLDPLQPPFSLVDLEYLFPTQYLPPEDAPINYGLINFGGLAKKGSINPSNTGFGFLLISGDSYAVTQLRKRDGDPDPFVFIDCPAGVMDQPDDMVQKARVVCLSEDIKGCFRVMERGVEGTMVEMPDNCAPNTFARAISLDVSQDQSLPEETRTSKPSSQVFDFFFDFNFNLVRRDTNNTSIRMDYSNVRGYWDSIVDSPGIQYDDVEKRFFAAQHSDWRFALTNANKFEFSSDDAVTVKEDLTAPLFWQTEGECPVGDEDYSEGVGAYVQGNVDAKFHYGFSMIAAMGGNSFDTKEVNGFLKVNGQTDLTYGIGGIGTVDIDRANKGNPAFREGNPVRLAGHRVGAEKELGPKGFASFQPYYQITYQMATFNGSGTTISENTAAAFSGRLTTRTITDLGDLTVYFPVPKDDPGDVDSREKNRISIPKNDVVYTAPGYGGRIAIGTYVIFGLKPTLAIAGDMYTREYRFPDMSVNYNTMTEFAFFPGEVDGKTTACSEYTVMTNVFPWVENYDLVDWGVGDLPTFKDDKQQPEVGKVCYPDESAAGKREVDSTGYDDNISPTANNNNINNNITALATRQTGGLEWDLDSDLNLNPDTFFNEDLAKIYDNGQAIFPCGKCIGCAVWGLKDRDRCCGCVCMDCVWGSSDIPCDSCKEEQDSEWPGDGFMAEKRDEVEDEQEETDDDEDKELHQLDRRVPGRATESAKSVRVCGLKLYAGGQYKYPAFPGNAFYPWDGIQNGKWDSISRYWGNSSADCTNWGTTDLNPHDTRRTGSRAVRAPYQTEHVFEGQLIGDFFSLWLEEGQIRNQNPPASNPQPKVPCDLTERYITKFDSNFPWKVDGEATPFIKVLLAELGSIAHLDRLTIYLRRLNRKKGSMFSGYEPTNREKYLMMNDDEQLQSVKEMGMVFTYLNNQKVWDKFCATYEAIHDHLGDFDTWYAQNGQAVAIPPLQDEWKKYIRVVLDSLVLRSRASFDFMKRNANSRSRIIGSTFNAPYAGMWLTNIFANRLLIQLPRTCKHMDPPNV